MRKVFFRLVYQNGGSFTIDINHVEGGVGHQKLTKCLLTNAWGREGVSQS